MEKREKNREKTFKIVEMLKNNDLKINITNKEGRGIDTRYYSTDEIVMTLGGCLKIESENTGWFVIEFERGYIIVMNTMVDEDDFNHVKLSIRNIIYDIIPTWHSSRDLPTSHSSPTSRISSMSVPISPVTSSALISETLPLLPNIKDLNDSVTNFIQVNNIHELEVGKMYLIRERDVLGRYDIIAQYKNKDNHKLCFTELYKRKARGSKSDKRNSWIPAKPKQELVVFDSSFHNELSKIYILPIDKELLQRVGPNDYNEILKQQQYNAMASTKRFGLPGFLNKEIFEFLGGRKKFSKRRSKRNLKRKTRK